MEFRKSTSVAAVLFSQFMYVGPAHSVEADEVLLLAEDVGRWLSSTAIERGNIMIWPDDALAPEKIGYDLASGASGKVVYFIALYRATGNPEYLKCAMQGADFLISTLDDPGQFDGDQRRASLYAGVSGIGVALLHVREESSDPKYGAAFQRVLDILDDWEVEDENGSHWSEQLNDLLYGDAGTVLFLSHVAERDGDPDAFDAAQDGGRFLLSQSIDADDGIYWLFRRDKEFNLPNFSHGAAGVAYVLGTVGAQSENAGLLDGAEDGFEYVRSIAQNSDGALRIPYGWGSDNWQGLYEFGWAHGLAGTSLMFAQMQQLGIDRPEAEELLSQSRETLTHIDLPGTPAEPFSEPSTPLDMRFGRAGVLTLASFWAEKYPDDKAMSALRDSLFEQIRSAAIREQDTAYWQVDAPEFMGGGRAAYTGMFHGAAGIGLALLNMHASLVHKPHYAELPDDPL